MSKATPSHAEKSATMITRIAYVIAVTGAIGSYGTQVTYLILNGVGWFSWVIPATIDLLAIASAMALQLPGLDRASRKIAGGILFVTVSVSVTANVAGGHGIVAKAAHAWPVVAYLLGELLANRVRAYAARLTTEPVGTQTAAPAVPAQRKPRGDYGPRDPQRGYAPRTQRRKTAAQAAK
jgi:hypothetical protein